jgi:hypothetical protein
MVTWRSIQRCGTIVARCGSGQEELPVRWIGSRRRNPVAIYNLIGTVKLNGIDPESYLRNVLCRIADYPINHIEELLPWNFPAESAEASTSAA